MEKKKLLVLTGGGDCPGLNAVIRAIVKSAKRDGNWEVHGSIEAFNGIMENPPNVVKLNSKKVGGIHVKGGTIIKTTNRGNPLKFQFEKEDGTIEYQDITEEMIRRIKDLGFSAVVNIGGDGSQKISHALFEKGLPIIGVPKTIDNDLSSTDLTFGFSTAVQIATDAFDKLVSTAESHHRTMILEVMGRDAGWIALHTAIAGGAELCLIPEIPFDLNVVQKQIEKRYKKGRGFVNIVISEGAKAIGANVSGQMEKGHENIKLGGVANLLRRQLEDAGCEAEIRTAILGHIQRGGSPIAFDRILATALGVKAFEMVKEEAFGQMAIYKNNQMGSCLLSDAIKDYNFVDPKNYLINTARKIGISFGDAF